MPLWLDLLRTPMAAPETRLLRRMRLTWQSLCLGCAAGVGFFRSIAGVAGRSAAIAIGLLLFVTLSWTVVYWKAKQRADRAFLETMGSGE